MPTREEILSKHEANFLQLEDGRDYSTLLHAAMEEYAKQEVKAFINDGRYFKFTEIQFDEFWNEYQKNKLK